jgi:hypothetical protein
MTPEMHQTVNYLLHAYKRTGAKLYRRKENKSLVFGDDMIIFLNQPKMNITG